MDGIARGRKDKFAAQLARWSSSAPDHAPDGASDSQTPSIATSAAKG